MDLISESANYSPYQIFQLCGITSKCYSLLDVSIFQPSRTRPPPDLEPPTNEQGDPPSPPLSGEDEGLGSEPKLDRPSSAKGTRRRTSQANSDSDAGMYNIVYFDLFNWYLL